MKVQKRKGILDHLQKNVPGTEKCDVEDDGKKKDDEDEESDTPDWINGSH